MGFDYVGLRTNVVLPALRKYGQAVTYRSFSQEFDETTGENVRVATEISAYAVVGEYKLGAIDGTLVRVGDKRLLTAEIPEPRLGDQVVLGSTTYTVVSPARVISPAGEAVLYELQVRA